MGTMRTPSERHSLQPGGAEPVRRLRPWGERDGHALPSTSTDLIIGSAPSCELRIDRPGVSRHHAQLTNASGSWIAIDLASKNGVYVDGLRVGATTLVSGTELRIGPAKLLVEGARFAALHDFIGRLIGWADPVAVDDLLRSVRGALRRRTVLYVSGEDDLVLFANSLHRRAVGNDRPFVVCDPRRRVLDESVRSAASRPGGVEGYRAAAGGTLCVLAQRMPSDIESVLSLHARSDAPAALLIVVGEVERNRLTTDIASNPPIRVPSIASRAADLSAIIDEYAREAAWELGVPDMSADDRAWVRQHSIASFTDIEKAARRIVAIRGSRSLTRAAERLDMATVSLRRWLDRRASPSSVERRFL